MPNWTVSIEVASPTTPVAPFDEEALDEFTYRIGGVATLGRDARRYSSTFSVFDAESIVEACRKAEQFWFDAVSRSGMPEYPIVWVECATFDEADRRLDAD